MISLVDVFVNLVNYYSENLNYNNFFVFRSTFQNNYSFNLDYQPISKYHLIVFRNGELIPFDKYNINDKTVSFINIAFQINDLIEIYYFANRDDDIINTEISQPLEFDEFNGGSSFYNLRLGALDSSYILVTKNNRVISDYQIRNGVLYYNNSNALDKIRVYYLNRGILERRSKISIRQIETSSVDTVYRKVSDTYSKNEFDTLFFNLKGQLPIGLDNLQKIAQAIANNPNYYNYIQTEINKLADLVHNHDDVYYPKTIMLQILNDYHDTSNMMSNTDLQNQLNSKINLDEVYTKEEIDNLTQLLPGKNPNNRGLFISGGVSRSPESNTNIMDLINIISIGNAIFFGNFPSAKRGLAATSNGIKNSALVFGGSNSTSIFKLSILNQNISNYFGDLLQQRNFATANSNGSLSVAVVMGGNNLTRDMEYRFIESNEITGGIFGQLSEMAKDSTITSVSSGKNNRIVFGPIYTSTSSSYYSEYINPSVLGNSLQFGELMLHYRYPSGTSNDVNDRGVFIGGVFHPSNLFSKTIQLLNISVLSNSTLFGELITARALGAAVSNGIGNRGVIAGGNIGTNASEYIYTNSIEFMNISQPSNSTNFGNLILARGDGLGGVSNGAL